MRKIALSILLALFTINTSLAQVRNASIEIGEKTKKGFTTGIGGVVATDEGGYYILTAKSKGFYLIIIPIGVRLEYHLDYYSYDMKLQRSTKIHEVSYGIYSRNKKHLEFITQDDQQNVYIYYSQKDKVKTNLYQSKLNKDLFVFQDKKKVSTLKNLGKKKRRRNYNFYTSNDGKQKAIVSYSSTGTKGSTNIHALFLDESLKVVDEREEVVPFNISGYGYQHSFRRVKQATTGDNEPVFITNTGAINILAKVYISSKKWFTSGYYDYHLISISEKSRKPIVEKLKFKNKIPLDVSIKNNGDFLSCIGFFSNEDKYGFDGVFNFKLDPETLKITDKNIKSFTNKDKEQFLISKDDKSKRGRRKERKLKKKLKKNKDVDIINYDIIDLVNFDNGSSTLISEYSRVVTTTTTTPTANGGSSTTTTTTYINGDLVFIHFNKKGDIMWIKNIHKYQTASSPIGIGISYFRKGNYINVIYSDLREKELMLLSIDKKGEFKKKAIAKMSRKSDLGKYYFIPSSAVPTQENEVIGFAIRRTKSKMLKFTF